MSDSNPYPRAPIRIRAHDGAAAMSDDEQKAFMAKAQELAPKDRTELLQSAD